jgi:hypothetical protein
MDFTPWLNKYCLRHPASWSAVIGKRGSQTSGITLLDSDKAVSVSCLPVVQEMWQKRLPPFR